MATLIAVPLFRAGQAPLALMGLEFAGLGLLLLALWRPLRLRRVEWIVLVALAVYPLLYLIPLPLGLIEGLAGRAAYVDAWRMALGPDGLPTTATLSLAPSATEAAWLALLLPIGVFVGVRALAPRQLYLLIGLLLATGAVQAVLGLMQYGDGADSSLYLGMEFTHFGSAVGTYTNRNHLAGLIEMVLPITLALLFFTAGRGRDQRRSVRARAAFMGSQHGREALLYGSLVILLLVAVAFTRSRMGVSLVMLGILLSLVLFARRIGGTNTFGPLGTLVAFALGLAVIIGLVPVLDRFTVEGVTDDLRWVMFDHTLTGIGTFFPVGSGPGSYGDVFPAYQPPELGRWFINRAHNDYLEWLFEGGVLAAALILGLVVLYLNQWRNVWATGEWSRLRFVQVGAGIGILLVALHELVDYNLHIPANMAFFALLFGIFFSDVDAPDGRRAATSGRRTQRLGETTMEPVFAPLTQFKPAADQIKNPFLDD